MFRWQAKGHVETTLLKIHMKAAILTRKPLLPLGLEQGIGAIVESD
jgi:hypothetical protein